jgi:hypothetical protein
VPSHPQALPEGHTRPCYPIQSPGVGQHRATVSRDQEAQALERRRLALIAAATNVRVGRCCNESSSAMDRALTLSCERHSTSGFLVACAATSIPARWLFGCLAQLSSRAASAQRHPDTRPLARGGGGALQVARWLGERLARPCGAKYLQSARDVPLPTEMQSPSLDDG